MDHATGTRPCAICATPHPGPTMRAFGNLTESTRDQIRRDWPDLPADAPVCPSCTARYRRRHLEALLEAERGALTALDHEVLDSLQSGLPVAEEPEGAWVEDRSFGERAADTLARIGGSWGFILAFAVVLAVWMAVNVTGAIFGTFDPYPFILLNLALSTLAALQAPVIMMSQRRQEAKDRLRSENDYKVNLKAELEIRHLHDKIDLHLTRQWERLAAIQRLQIELLEEQARDDR